MFVITTSNPSPLYWPLCSTTFVVKPVDSSLIEPRMMFVLIASPSATTSSLDSASQISAFSEPASSRAL